VEEEQGEREGAFLAGSRVKKGRGKSGMAIEEVGGSGHGEVRMEREATRGGSQRSRRPGGSSGADGATTRARIGRGVARKTRLCGGTPNFVMHLLLLQPFITMPSRASSPHGVRPAGQGHPSIAPHVAPSPPGSKRPSYLSCLPWLVNLFQSLAFTPFSSAFSSANGLEHDANHQERRSRASEPFIPPWEDFEVPVQPLDSDMVVPDWRHESPKVRMRNPVTHEQTQKEREREQRGVTERQRERERERERENTTKHCCIAQG
jgi:hypothetical protein